MMGPINCKGKLLHFDEPRIMGIINVTPDSFYDGGRTFHVDNAVEQAIQMVAEGAHIVDIGGMSSRPGAKAISVEEEKQRIIPVVTAISSALPESILSVDTYRSDIAEMALNAGAHMINDISGGDMDDGIWNICAKYNAPYVLMHMKGEPATMQDNPIYTDVVLDILKVLKNKVVEVKNRGVKDIIIDPGFGFGKTINDNYQILKKLSSFRILDCPLLVGLSRKSMLYKFLGITPDQALNATTAAHIIALSNGASILRVHDVREAKQCIDVWKKVNN